MTSVTKGRTIVPNNTLSKVSVYLLDTNEKAIANHIRKECEHVYVYIVIPNML